MREKLLLTVIAAALLITAATGITLGLASMDESDPDDQASTIPTTGPDAPEDNPEPLPDITPDANPTSLIRFGTTHAPPKPEGTIRLATYNVENLFDDVDDPDLAGRNEDIDDAKPPAELQALADTITALDADILALQEIESEAALRAFLDTYLPDAGYNHIASPDAGDARGIEQSVLSRYPITSVTNWPQRDLEGTHPQEWGTGENWNAGEPIRFHRSPLRATIEVPAEDDTYTLTLYVVHAKSGRPGEYWRAAEAQGLVELLQSEDALQANTAILGDFNALLSDGSVQTYITAGLTDALAPRNPRGRLYTTHESGRRIDHILITPNLAADLVPGTGFVLGTPALPEGLDWRDPWRPEGYASDHYPVAIDLIPADAPNN